MYCVKVFCDSAKAKNATSNGMPEIDPILYMSVWNRGNPSGTATNRSGVYGKAKSISA